MLLMLSSVTSGILTSQEKSGFLFCCEYSATIPVLYTSYCPCAESVICLGDHLRSHLLDSVASGQAQTFPSSGYPLL